MVSNSSSSVQQPLCHDSENFALLQFKQSFLIDEHASNDPSAYPKVAMWNSHGEGEGSDCRSWDGVECDRETGHVIDLHLASSFLYGSINSSSGLFNLVHLQRLDLSDNYFHHFEIRNGIVQLPMLRSLNLSYSVFSSQIPSELLALSELVFLDLSENPMLQHQKPGLRNLVNISSTIPHALAANLSSLKSLLLEECGLHGEFPMNIFQLPSLHYLPEFQETSRLRWLYLGGTSFSGELPTSIGRLGSLIELDISSCNFTGLVPSSLGHLTQLSHLVLLNNSFSGQISSFLGNLTQLSYLDLSNNYFSGQIPSFLANFTQLTSLSLSFNNFNVGTLAWLGQQTKLTGLDLDTVNLSGEISSSLVNMSQLTRLDLEENQLTGQIPSWLMDFT
ncbi:hypothetical protein PVL29_015652 [Vitis rotundifolia]|uniref:Disease resistance R13L4/SHOC-2-like LRR domain-containing protein n=1 Tax=Vitis rotundifolia TaxID=103349 RepID=A0AA38ZD84_VITRO|nr:hypothetical protein PVL29_015652 [Vitis rotundifolia]